MAISAMLMDMCISPCDMDIDEDVVAMDIPVVVAWDMVIVAWSISISMVTFERVYVQCKNAARTWGYNDLKNKT